MSALDYPYNYDLVDQHQEGIKQCEFFLEFCTKKELGNLYDSVAQNLLRRIKESQVGIQREKELNGNCDDKFTELENKLFFCVEELNNYLNFCREFENTQNANKCLEMVGEMTLKD